MSKQNESIKADKVRLKNISDLSYDDSVELAKIHKYDFPENEGVRPELIEIYSFNDGTLTLGAYLPVKQYVNGLFYLINNGYDVGQPNPLSPSESAGEISELKKENEASINEIGQLREQLKEAQQEIRELNRRNY